MWTTGPFLQKAIKLMESWGFKFCGVFIYWVKNGKNCMGRHTRQCVEFLLKGERGCASNTSENIQPITITTERGVHSVKPMESFEVMQEVMENLPAIELFAREVKYVEFDYFGNEVGKLGKKEFSEEEIKESRKIQQENLKRFKNGNIGFIKKSKFNLKISKPVDTTKNTSKNHELSDELKRTYGIISANFIYGINEEDYDFPIKDIANENSVLFTIIKSHQLGECFNLIDKWKFKYKTMFCVLCSGKSEGKIVQGCVDVVLISGIGSVNKLKFDKNVYLKNFSKSKTRNLSYFYECIGKLFENIPRLEINSNNWKDGWDHKASGNFYLIKDKKIIKKQDELLIKCNSRIDMKKDTIKKSNKMIKLRNKKINN
jgi:N6-adenosine-specific RNA methylase IME4